MYTDTHTHLLTTANRGVNIPQLLLQLANENTPFVLDIGTNPADTQERVAVALNTDTQTVPNFIHFSAGLWPSPEVIQDRKNALVQLKNDLSMIIPRSIGNAEQCVCAVGECGFDRKTNPVLTAEETELFELQIDIAKQRQLPLIIHSRDAFTETFECIQNGGWDCGVIHCFSYTKEEARMFLDRGWYISFPGTITYKHTEYLAEALKYVPDDRLMLETDAPYLAPVPFRGQTNTTLLISNTYAKAAEVRNTTVEHLVGTVFENARTLFTPNK